MNPIPLPAIGTLFGSSIYLDRGDYVFQTTGQFYTSWVSEDHDPEWYLERVLSERQGNLVVLWDGGAVGRALRAAAWWHDLAALGLEAPAPDWEHGRFLVPEDWPPLAAHRDRAGAGMVRFVREAAAQGLWCYVLYADAAPEWSRQLQQAGGQHYLGYNVGEKFCYRFDENSATPETATLTGMADALRQAVRRTVAERRAAGWGRLLTTSGSFHLDYEIDAGLELPITEDFAFAHLGMASALARGLYRQYDLPLWGTDIAHEHYCWLPYASPYRFRTLRLAFYHKYLAGCKLMHLESGNWWQQSDHVADTPMHDTPKVALGPIHVNDPRRTAASVAAARPHYPRLNYDSPACRAYRREVAAFYAFLQEHGTPQGQPEARLAILKGNLDLASQEYHPNQAIGGAYWLAEHNPHWFEHAPERGWDIVRNTFYPRPPTLGDHPNRCFSGNPYGQVDIVSLAGPLEADFLLAHYRVLILAGWNTATPAQYRLLTEYVRRGGILFLGIPHLSTNDTRNFTSYTVNELVHGGDFTELCGVRVRGRGARFYWATTPDATNHLGFTRPLKYGIFCTQMGELELTANPEVLLVEDELFRPLLLRHRLGQGQTWFLNSWDYPGALDGSFSLACQNGDPGLMGVIFRQLGLLARGPVYVTDDGHAPGRQCDFIAWSHFPDAGQVCLLNIDCDHPHRFVLHRHGVATTLELAPEEFRTVAAVAAPAPAEPCPASVT
jgi:hypothetical protein